MVLPSFIELEHVTVVRGERSVLNDVSLEVLRGEQIVILGPNGCGKSTLLKAITCELYPLAQPGTKVSILGREHWDLSELKRRLGVVQNEIPGKPMLKISGRSAVLTGFFGSSTLWPNLEVTPAMQLRTDEVLEQIGATRLHDKVFGEMSAGEQRRILIGRALVASADCLLLDEPSNALDLLAQRGLRKVLISLAEKGVTLFHITHHIADIIPAMQRIVMMKDGRIMADGNRAELLTEKVLSELFQTNVHLAENAGVLHAW